MSRRFIRRIDYVDRFARGIDLLITGSYAAKRTLGVGAYEVLERPIRVLVVDDHPFALAGMRVLIGEESGIRVVGEASSAEEALERARATTPDVVVMDLHMRGLDGAAATAQLKVDCPTTRVLIVSGDESPDAVTSAVRSGACGYISKSAPIGEIVRAIRSVHNDGAYLPVSVVGAVLHGLRAPLASGRVVDTMTERERQVLSLIGDGMSARRIASALGISERTVHSHVGKIYKRMGVNNRVDAVRTAMRSGMLPTDVS